MGLFVLGLAPFLGMAKRDNWKAEAIVKGCLKERHSKVHKILGLRKELVSAVFCGDWDWPTVHVEEPKHAVDRQNW